MCVDIQAAIAQRAGVGRYTKKLVEQLGEQAGTGDELALFHFDFKRVGQPFPVRQAEWRTSQWVPGRLVQQAWKRVGLPAFDRFAGNADLYHFPNFIRPPMRHGCRTVVTIHDLSFLRFPETMEAKNFRYQNAQIRETVRRADVIITDAAAIADEVAERLDVPRDKVHPIHLGLDQAVPPSTQDVARVRAAAGLDRPYLLHVGTLEPRKNHLFLFDVFEALSGFDGDLVIAGMRGWKCEEILRRIEANPRIRYLEYVPDEDLPGLYAGASAFVYPSLYEGFGFPPLEALSCGTPVVSSPEGSLAEVLGDAAVVVPVFDRDAWGTALESLLAAPPDPLVGQDWCRRYDWSDTARETWALYRRLVEGT